MFWILITDSYHYVIYIYNNILIISKVRKSHCDTTIHLFYLCKLIYWRSILQNDNKVLLLLLNIMKHSKPCLNFLYVYALEIFSSLLKSIHCLATKIKTVCCTAAYKTTDQTATQCARIAHIWKKAEKLS